MQSILHSLFPRRLRNHSIPSPVHSALRAVAASNAALVTAVAVELIISTTLALNRSAESGRTSVGSARLGEPGLGRNQLLPKSKKQRSDQLHEVRKRMSRRMEQ